ncbi:MAG: O-antigen ligase family protein [Syntrophales bacterium]|nr:O-antigen ligase family protein [Syntrophales bacterium]
MGAYRGASSQELIIALVIILLTLAGAVLISQASMGIATMAIIGVVVAVFTFLNTEFALYALLVAMLLGPQVGLAGTEVADVRGRGITLRVDDFLLIIIGITWFFKTAVEKELGLFLRTPLNAPIGIYFLVCIISTIFGYMTDRIFGLKGFFFVLKYFEYYVVYFMVVNHLREKKQIERFTLTIFGVCFIVSLIAIYSMSQGIRASAPFEGFTGEPNTLGGYLIFIISLVIGLLLTWGNRMQKFLLALLLVTSTIALAATLSRTSWIAIGPMTLCLLYFSDRKRTILFSIVILIALAPFIAPKSVQNRLLFTINQPKETGQMRVGNVNLDTSTSARFESMKQVLTRDFARQPVIGFGITGYPFLDAQYARVLAETGIMGMVAFIYLIYNIFRNAKETYLKTNDPFFKGLTLGYLTGFFAILAHCVGANTFIIVRIMEPFWFVTAVMIMIPRIEAGEFLKSAEPAPLPPMVPRRTVLPGSSPDNGPAQA